jgi:proline iminopeptidase
VNVPGGRVWCRTVGSGPGLPLLVLHGGPGFTCEYLEPLAELGDERAVVMFDQLGCGRSDRPGEKTLWTADRFVEEVACVRRALGLDRIHLLGQSWGSMLAVDAVLAGATGISSLVLASPPLSIPLWMADAGRLRAQLPPDVQQALTRHEASGFTACPEYRAASLEYSRRFICRGRSLAGRLRTIVRRRGRGGLPHDVGPQRVHRDRKPGQVRPNRPVGGHRHPHPVDLRPVSTRRRRSRRRSMPT